MTTPQLVAAYREAFTLRVVAEHAAALVAEASSHFPNLNYPPRHPRWCLHLLDHPNLIAFNREIIVRLLGVARRHISADSPRGLSPRDIAALIDWLQIGGMSLEEARRAIASSTGKSYDTVKKAHLRHGGKAP